MKKLIMLLALRVLFPAVAFPAVIHVPGDIPTIQAAILSAATGDTVLVEPGTYSELINFQGKEITVASLFLVTGDTAYVGQTVISASSKDPVVIFENGETMQSRLVGFTITNGKGKEIGPSSFGGGIYCEYSHPSLEHLCISGNIAPGMGGCGGGAYFRDSHPVMKDCIIGSNEAYYGGGIRCDGADITITGCWFRNNYAVGSGGGAMFLSCASPKLESCTFTGNSSIYGGALCCNSTHLLVDRLTSYHNMGAYGGTINMQASHSEFLNSILWENSMDPSVTNEIFIGSGGNTLLVAFCDILGEDTCIHGAGAGSVDWMEGNIGGYPMFTDTLSLDLTLQEASPCMDAGTALYISNGDTLVNLPAYSGPAPDMGAYEYDQNVYTDPEKGPARQPGLWVTKGNAPGEKVVIYEISGKCTVEMVMSDIRGRTVMRIPGAVLPAGRYSVVLSTAKYSPGIYLVRIIAGHESASVKVPVGTW